MTSVPFTLRVRGVTISSDSKYSYAATDVKRPEIYSAPGIGVRDASHADSRLRADEARRCPESVR